MSVVKSVFLGLWVGVFLACIFAFGFFLRDFMDVSYGNVFFQADASAEYGLLLEAQAIIDQVYLREQPDSTTRQYAAIRGVLGVLNDRNTFFIEPPVARSESQVLAGVYGGIGVAVQRSEDGRVLLYPFEDSPALRAGVQQGDVLVAVNREPILASDSQDAIDQKLRGEVKDGNGVLLNLLTDGAERELFVAFDVIRVPSIMWRMVTPSIGYIHIMRFTNRTPSELSEAYASLIQEATLSGLVLDLRNNSGGLLEEAIQVAGFFLDAGVVTYEVNKTTERPYSSPTRGVVTDLPLVVLVNQRTASASELVAGAIQDRNRGILVGQVTYGKGTVQQIYSLSDGSSIHVTSAEWLTPNRNALDGVGLQPNILMIPDASGRDVELGEAIRYLQQAGHYECKNCQSPF
jgi:carboxyl-terminal processing protease